LLSIMDRKDHASYWRLMGPGATRRQLLTHYRQEWAVYVRDFPIFLARVHARCPVPEIRQELAENLYEEETGKISGGGPHAELFLQMMEGLRFDRRHFEQVRLLPESRAYRTYLDHATLRSPWVVGLAVATIFVEGSRNDRSEISAEPLPEPAPHAGPRERTRPSRFANGAPSLEESIELLTVSCQPAGGIRVAVPPADPLASDPLVVHHGLDPRYLELKRVHRKVEGGHRLSAWNGVLSHAATPLERTQVTHALERALSLWTAYRDGVSDATRR
jgi:pyrroloquinoline-quinone synthase